MENLKREGKEHELFAYRACLPQEGQEKAGMKVGEQSG